MTGLPFYVTLWVMLFIAASDLPFTAIDFETANRSRNSACAAGLVRVEDGRLLQSALGLHLDHHHAGSDAKALARIVLTACAA